MEQIFEITDESSAEWALEKLGEVEAERRKVQEQYEKMVSRYQHWLKSSVEKLDDKAAYFQGLLAKWAEGELADSKKKSVSLPSGRVGFRAGTKEFLFGGEKASQTNAALLEYCRKEKPETIERRESVKWAELKKSLHPLDDGRVCDENGEIVPGMTCKQGEPTFYAEVTA